MVIGFGVAVGAVAALTGAFKTYEAIQNSTQVGAEEWKEMMAGLKSGFDSFMRSIKNSDWSNLITNMKEAIKLGREYQAFLDQYEKRNKAQDIANIETQTKVIELRTQAKALMAKALGQKGEERAATITLAEKDYASALSLENSILSDNLKLKQEKLSKSADYYLATNKELHLSKNQLEQYIKEYNANTKIINQARAYNDLIKQKNDLVEEQSRSTNAKSGLAGIDNSYAISGIEKTLKATSPMVKGFADIEKALGNSTGKIFDNLAQQMKESAQAVLANTQGKARDIVGMAKAEARLALQGDKEVEKEDAKNEKLLEKREQLEKGIQALISKYRLGDLGEQMANELKEVQSSKEFKQLKIDDAEKAERVLQAIRNNYGELALNDLAEQIAKEKKIKDDAKKALEAETEGKITSVVLSATQSKGDELSELKAQLQNKQITIQEFKQREKEINEKYDEQILNKKLEILETELEAEKLAGDDTVSLEQKIADLKLSILNKENADFTANIDDKKAKEIKAIKDKETLQKAEINLGKQAIDEVGSALSESYQTDLAEYTKAQESKKTRLKDQLDDGIITKQQYDQKITQIDRDTAKKQAESAKKQADIAIAVALVNTAAALATSISTAIAGSQVAALSGGPAAPILSPIYIVEMVGEVLAGFASVYSAIQKSQSVQVPGYEKGREGGPAEWAILHPGELRGKDGKYYPTPGVPALTFLSGGESVIPRPDVEAMTRAGLLSGMGNSVMMNFGTKSLEDKVENLQNGFRMVCRTINEQPGTQINITEKGIFTVVKKGNSTYEYHKKNTP